MAKGEKNGRRIAAAQLVTTPERVARWDKFAADLAMSRSEFIRFAVDSLCAKLEADGEK